MTQEVLKLALECAERCEHIDGMYSWTNTITAIKEALREHAMREVQRLGQEIEQEPVAYINVEKRRLEFAEPMVWQTPTVVNLERIPLYTHQRTWVGLTDEDVDGFVEQYWSNENMTMRSMMKAIEAKLKENT
jgi:hypothetical protein